MAEELYKHVEMNKAEFNKKTVSLYDILSQNMILSGYFQFVTTNKIDADLIQQ